ncbi:MAG TPA: hypothetical protein EYP29_02035 [Thermoplasmata archaeon]|nr:hypothetical protein [Thermoplasmata archaeon]
MAGDKEMQCSLKVRKGDIQLPFSKGLLISTILKTGVGLELADEITDEVFQHFLKMGKKEVEAGEIKDFVFETLLKRGMREAADLYLLVERIKNTRTTVTILLGGVSGVGKTTVASEIGRRLGITNMVGTDMIREIIKHLEPENPFLQHSTFTVGKILNKKLKRDDKDYRKNVVEGFLSQSQIVSKGINAVLVRARKEGINIIIDGANLVPSLLKKEFLEPSNFHVFPFLLTLSDLDTHIQRFQSRSTESRRQAERYIAHLSEIHAIQDFLVEDARKMKVMVIENMNFEETVKKILATISKNLL